MTYYAPISYPQASPFNGRLEFREVYREKSTLNQVLPYVISSIGYPIIALASAFYWFYLSYDSYKKQQSLTLVEHKWKYIENCTEDTLTVAVALRERKIKTRLMSLTPVVHSVKTTLGIEGVITEQKLKTIRFQRISHIEASEEGLSKADKVAELDTQIRVLYTYERLRKELEEYLHLHSDLNALKETFLRRIAFRRLRIQIALVVNNHVIENIRKVLIPIFGLKTFLDSPLTTRYALEESGLTRQYNQSIREIPWLKPY